MKTIFKGEQKKCKMYNWKINEQNSAKKEKDKSMEYIIRALTFVKNIYISLLRPNVLISTKS